MTSAAGCRAGRFYRAGGRPEGWAGGFGGAGAAVGSGRQSMATITVLTPGSVDSAVIAGSHDAGSPNRARRSPTESCWICANSTTVMDSVTASRVRTSPLDASAGSVSQDTNRNTDKVIDCLVPPSRVYAVVTEGCLKRD